MAFKKELDTHFHPMPSLPENPKDFITAMFAQPGAGKMAEQL